MWINETVFAAGLCYRYGLAVPLIALMAALGVMAKIRVPDAHTSLEIIRMRYGKIGHLVFVLLNLSCNVFGCASMILTGSQLIYGISHMHFVAATMLIPLGVNLYTAVGGLKATFLTDYLHTAIALVLIIYFTLSVLTNEAVGADNKIAGNYEGSLLNMKSSGAIIWGLILKFGNLALVVMDTAFWQKSFAAEVKATVPGYNLAALAIFGIPWGLRTVIGLSARAIHNTPIFPIYPGQLTTVEVNAGLVMPYTIKALMGDKGIVAFFVLLFMALTSTISSSIIAVSSILSFDVYKTYINPKASDRRLVHVSHLAVIIHGIFTTGISLAMNYGGANMTWIGYFRPILICPGILPLIFALTWSGQTRLAAITAPILGFATGITIWLSVAKHMYGVVNLTSTGQDLPALYGAIGSFFSPALYSIIISQYKPYNFDWREFLRIELLEDAVLETPIPERSSTEASSARDPEKISVSSGKSGAITTALPSPLNAASPRIISLDNITHPFSEETLQELHHCKRFFSGWTTVAVVWQFFAFGAVVIFPLYDGRHAIAKGSRGVWNAAQGYFGR
ncbi:hypothetical protein N431DRAFT_547364 [Stipitochalara longipes BDJ]|nr:hypothetical protein N431DRAFT_547364 [Stipitochalara longipes BDJ]